MKLTRNSNNNLGFLSLWKTFSLLLLLVGIALKSYGQIYVGNNAIVFVQKGTELHISEEKTNPPQTVKIYIEENAHIINFPNDTAIEIVYLKKQKPLQKNKKTSTRNSSAQPSPPPMIEKDIESENGTSVLSFNSIPRTPSGLFYSGQSTKAALVHNTNLGTKFFPQKKSYYNSNNHLFYLNDNNQIKFSSNDFLLSWQTGLKAHITRPPPFLYS